MEVQHRQWKRQESRQSSGLENAIRRCQLSVRTIKAFQSQTRAEGTVSLQKIGNSQGKGRQRDLNRWAGTEPNRTRRSGSLVGKSIPRSNQRGRSHNIHRRHRALTDLRIPWNCSDLGHRFGSLKDLGTIVVKHWVGAYLCCASVESVKKSLKLWSNPKHVKRSSHLSKSGKDQPQTWRPSLWWHQSVEKCNLSGMRVTNGIKVSAWQIKTQFMKVQWHEDSIYTFVSQSHIGKPLAATQTVTGWCLRSPRVESSWCSGAKAQHHRVHTRAMPGESLLFLSRQGQLEQVLTWEKQGLRNDMTNNRRIGHVDKGLQGTLTKGQRSEHSPPTVTATHPDIIQLQIHFGANVFTFFAERLNGILDHSVCSCIGNTLKYQRSTLQEKCSIQNFGQTLGSAVEGPLHGTSHRKRLARKTGCNCGWSRMDAMYTSYSSGETYGANYGRNSRVHVYECLTEQRIGIYGTDNGKTCFTESMRSNTHPWAKFDHIPGVITSPAWVLQHHRWITCLESRHEHLVDQRGTQNSDHSSGIRHSWSSHDTNDSPTGNEPTNHQRVITIVNAENQVMFGTYITSGIPFPGKRSTFVTPQHGKPSEARPEHPNW